MHVCEARKKEEVNGGRMDPGRTRLGKKYTSLLPKDVHQTSEGCSLTIPKVLTQPSKGQFPAIHRILIHHPTVQIDSVTTEIFLLWTNVAMANATVTVGICSRSFQEPMFKVLSKQGQQQLRSCYLRVPGDGVGGHVTLF